MWQCSGLLCFKDLIRAFLDLFGPFAAPPRLHMTRVKLSPSPVCIVDREKRPEHCHTAFRIFLLIGIFSGVVSKWLGSILTYVSGLFGLSRAFLPHPLCAQYWHTAFRTFSLVGKFSGSVSKWLGSLLTCIPGLSGLVRAFFSSPPSAHDPSQVESEPRLHSRPGKKARTLSHRFPNIFTYRNILRSRLKVTRVNFELCIGPFST